MKRVKILNKRVIQVVKFSKEQQQAGALHLSQAVEKVKKQREAVEDQVDFLDQKYREILSSFEGKMEAHRRDIKQFKDYVATEYIDFFKNRQRIRSEMAQSLSDIREQLEFNKQGNAYNRKSFEVMSHLLPQLAEGFNLLLQSFKCDHSARELLQGSLRASEMPNDGYLFFDETKSAAGHKTASPLRNDRDQLQKSMYQNGFKFAVDRPIIENY